ncbi:MAG: hypothetical protein K0Q78_189 [Cellvibrio sp.]|nr:hypothetical protein [Cellvibrio sp.]
MIRNERDIRELAYYLWLSEGKPDGQSSRHWQIATKMVEEQKRFGNAPNHSIDPSEAKGATEPEQPDQT